MSDVIGDFIRRYVREQDYYERVAQLVGQVLQRKLRDRNVRNITTWRAKRPDRLEKKLRERDDARAAKQQERYQTDLEIYGDIPDLAGARVALYFPSEKDITRQIIEETFEQLRPPKEFPKDFDLSDAKVASLRNLKRFSGYAAEHYRVRLRPEMIGVDDARFVEGRCEIQVASVLMHAWSEVEHDLEYKDMTGHVSRIESVLLDQINGLVIAGEIALEQLRRATVERTTGGLPGAVLRDQYDLARWLERVQSPTGASVPDVGRADLAFSFLEKLGLTSIERLAVLEEGLRARLASHEGAYKLADHLIELLREQDPTRDAKLAEARREVTASEQATAPAATPVTPVETAALGYFLQFWRALERIAAGLRADAGGSQRGPSSIARTLGEFIGFKRVRAEELRALQVLRSQAVHGTSDAPTSAQLLEGARSLERLIRSLPEDALDEAAQQRIEKAMAPVLRELAGTSPSRVALAEEVLNIQAGPAICLVARRAIIVPFIVTNIADKPTTLAAIHLEVGGEEYVPSIPIDSIVVTGLPFRTPEQGMRLLSQDAIRAALFFDGAVVVPDVKTATLRIHSVRDGIIRHEVEVRQAAG